jgi:hypothetical protein
MKRKIYPLKVTNPRRRSPTTNAGKKKMLPKNAEVKLTL